VFKVEFFEAEYILQLSGSRTAGQINVLYMLCH